MRGTIGFGLRRVMTGEAFEDACAAAGVSVSSVNRVRWFDSGGGHSAIHRGRSLRGS
jgi:hypothetical protein